MDPREFRLQPLGICYKLYHFITKTLASQALKTLTLGRPTHYSSRSIALRGSGFEAGKEVRIDTPSEDDGDKELPPTHGDSISSPAEQTEKKNNPCMNVDETAREDMTSALSTRSLSEAKPPKKTVSINDNVEIVPIKKKWWSRSFRKSSSLDQKEEEEPKPPRSILKVGSDLKDKSNSIS